MKGLLVSLASLLLLGVGQSGAAAPAVSDDAVDPLTAYLDDFAETHRSPGLAVAVLSGSEIVYEDVRGHDGYGRAVETSTPFLVGSIAKSLTATLVMQLVEEGQLSLGAPVTEHLDWFVPPGGGAALTVRHLLSHTSGFSTQTGLAHSDRFDNSPDALQSVVEELASVDLDAPPGEQYAYSNANYLVLGAVVEEVTGRPFGEVLRERILDPLGMDDSAVTADEAQEVDLAPGHRYFLGRPQAFASDFDGSGVPYGYVAASLDDLVAFASANLNAGAYGSARILEPRSIEAMQEPEVQIGEERWYGLGWRTGALTADHDYVEHTGATPGYLAHVVMVPGSDVAVVLLANSYSEARAPSLAGAAYDLARLSLGEKPSPRGNDPMLVALPYGLFGVAGLGLVAIALVVARHVRSRPGRRGAVRVLRLPIAAVLVAATLWRLPALLGYSLEQARLWMPDAGAAVVVGALAWLAVAVTSLASDAVLRRGRVSA